MYRCEKCKTVFADCECTSCSWYEIPGIKSPFNEYGCPYCGAGSEDWEDLGPDEMEVN
jgi:hypothetical protein